MSDYSIRVARFAGRSALRGVAADIWIALHEMLRARRTRRMLGEMDDRMLADIGIGRGDALTEASRPMWDLARRRR
jgi:uncharacterized protein YjiS (DUF1127 family)